ncbi:hypothetical protein AB0C77_23940 [Streptomyces sp. NPDC048629]|uniref:hypothetical protein n=1 Tax=Streptomyces sp. NPDC048629 TaxID=3154824 RepID=UPI00344A12C6
MSLCVDVYIPRPDGSIEELLDTPEGSSDLAGFERWRTFVWGSDAVRALGARYFPVLADNDLRVPPGEIAEFRRECALLRENTPHVAARDDPNWTHEQLMDAISARLANIEDAARRAERIGAALIIW